MTMMVPRLWRLPGDSGRGRLDRFFDDPFAELGQYVERWQSGLPVEVFERDGEVIVRAELAGVDPNDVDVRITDDGLTIRGERRSEAEHERGGTRYTERSYGSFARSIAFPAPVNADAAKATFRHGLLEVRAPRREPHDTRDGRRLQIDVN